MTLVMMMRDLVLRFVVLALCMCATAALSNPAWAQSSGRFDNSTSIDIENFQPMPAQGTNILNVGKSDVLPNAKPSVGVFLHYQDDPLIVQNPQTGETTARLMDSQLKAEIWAAYGFGDVFDFGIVLPFVVYQNTGDFDLFGASGMDMDGGALSDIRLVPKIRLLNPEKAAGVGIALAAPIYLPFGDSQSFNSDGALRAEPRFILDWRHENGLTIAANAAYQFRPRRTAQNFVSNDIVRWSVGTEIPVGIESVRVIGSIFGNYKLEEDRSVDNFVSEADDNKGDAVEALGGVQFSLPNDLVANVGAGGGVTNGIGAPDVRIFASFGYTPTTGDTDGDGIQDAEDQCVEDPEDPDGFEDQDGCPDDDNDQDGVVDDEDACPNTAEDDDGFEDADGCPDEDNDGDGINDADDECPDEAEDVDQFEGEDGCPDTDNDGDGILDEDDECPNTPGIEEADGCKPGDADGDGIKDHVDQCKTEPEDKDGFEDEDGCPDPDNDGDGIPDTEDKCPMEKETINGNKDEDGCPDKGKEKVKVTEEKIEILEKVYFDTAKATIKARSFNILDQVASVLKANPQITEVRIEGHTDSRGADDYNKKLSQQRADAVRDFLVKAGVAADRLTAEGYGEEQPIADNDSAAGRERNRRVEFSIVEVDGEPVEKKDESDEGDGESTQEDAQDDKEE
jgi:outer membrane protein OmpA-like peptidoglycan-associated protein